MNRFRSLLALVCLLVPVSLSAADWMVPAAAHAPGAAGTNWRTDLRIVNPAANAASVRIDLLPQNADNTSRDRSVTVNVPAQGQLSLTDVLETQFAFTGNAALLVGSSEQSLVVTSRTYNEAPSHATYGQFIPGVAVGKALTAGTPGMLIYLAKSSDYRTNVGFAGTTSARGTIVFTLYDQSGAKVGQGIYDVQPYGQTQINDIFAATGAPALPVARAVVMSTVPVIAYASIIDNRTGDPLAMLAVPESEASAEVVIPAVAHAPGAGGSAWRSDVRIYQLEGGGHDDNHGGATVNLAYYAGGTENPTPMTRTVALGANEVLALDDILLRTFGIENGTGALKITSDARLLATSRTYNQSPSGTFGQDVPAVANAVALAGNSTVVFSGLSDAGYRTNVGFFNLSSSALDLTLTLKRPDGSQIASKPFRLGANTSSQINVFSALEATGTSSAALSITGSGNAANKYLAYASVIDNASGDPVYVPAALSIAPIVTNPPPTNPSGCATLPYMRVGMKLGYRTSDGSYTSEQTVVADGPNQTIIRDKAVTAGSPSDIETTVDFVGGAEPRAATKMVSKAAVSAGGFSLTITTEMTFSTPWVVGPMQPCANTNFAIPATVQTTRISGAPGPAPGPTVYNRPADTGTVLAVGDSLTTAAGTFSTVKYKGTQGATQASVTTSIVWYDLATGALVRQVEYSPSGSIVRTLDLVSIQ